MAEINYCAYAERLEQLKRHPSVFIEEVCGIKLNRFQKTMVDQINKIKPTPRNPMKKWNNYINLCIAGFFSYIIPDHWFNGTEVF